MYPFFDKTKKGWWRDLLFDKPKKVTRAFVTLTSDPLRLPDGSHLPLVTKGRLWGRRRRCAALRRGAFGRDILFRHSTHYY